MDKMLPPKDNGNVITEFSLATSDAEISVAVATAQGQLLALTRYEKALVVQSSHTRFIERLEAAYAVAVIAPMGPLGAFLRGNRAADFD